MHTNKGCKKLHPKETRYMYSLGYTMTLVMCLLASVYLANSNGDAARDCTLTAGVLFFCTYAMAKHNLTPPQLVVAIFRRLRRG